MPNRENFPIPSELTPDTICLQIQIPNNDDWKQVILGLLAQPAYWFNWQRDEDHSGKTLAAYWNELFVSIDWSDMSCCCDQPPAIFRYDDDGVYQRSTDGGVTWVDAPEYDYRNTSITFPPPSALGIDNTKCQAADSAVVVLNEDVIQGLDNGSAIQAILEFVAAVLLFYLSAGTLATISIGLFAMAAAIFGFGVASTKAAFDSTVLAQLRCSIFNAMSSDDAIDATGFAALLVDINDNYTGIIKTSLYAIISAAGVIGVTNMIRSNRGDPDADCSGCTSSCDLANWTLGVGTLTSSTDTTWTVDAHFDGTQYAVSAVTGGSPFMECCHVAATASAGSIDLPFQYILCGNDNTNPANIVAPLGNPDECNWFFIKNAAPFTVVITFSA